MVAGAEGRGDARREEAGVLPGGRQREHSLADTVPQTPSLQRVRGNSCCYKSPSLCSFVAVATGHKYGVDLHKQPEIAKPTEQGKWLLGGPVRDGMSGPRAHWGGVRAPPQGWAPAQRRGARGNGERSRCVGGPGAGSRLHVPQGPERLQEGPETPVGCGQDQTSGRRRRGLPVGTGRRDRRPRERRR